MNNNKYLQCDVKIPYCFACKTKTFDKNIIIKKI